MTGRKSTKENFAYLPSTIADVDEYGNIIYSQWNYRILCHPIKMDVPVSRYACESWVLQITLPRKSPIATLDFYDYLWHLFLQPIEVVSYPLTLYDEISQKYQQ